MSTCVRCEKYPALTGKKICFKCTQDEFFPGQVFSYTPPPLVKQVIDALKFFNLKECHIKVNDDGSIEVQAKIIDANAKSTEE